MKSRDAILHEMHRSDRWIGWLLLGISLSFLVPAVWLAVDSVVFLRHAELAHGVVLRVDDIAPVVEYRTADGGVYRHTGIGSDVGALSEGDPVRVWHRRDDPEDARLDRFADLWILALVLAVFGGFWLLPVLFVFRPWRRGPS